MKKTLALILGVIMLMGCLSVSAAVSPLIVSSKPMNAIYFEDFSGASLDTAHITPGTATLKNGKLIASPANAANIAKVTFAPEGYADPVYLEFDVIAEGMSKGYPAQIQMSLRSTKGVFLDFRWYSQGDQQDYIASVSDASPRAYCDETPAHIKFKIDGRNKKLAMWVNDTQMISEDNCQSSIRYFDKFTDLVSFNMDLANANLTSLALDNFAVYSAKTSTIPAAGEEICHYDFDQAGVELASGLVSKDSGTTYTVADGMFKFDSDGKIEASTKIYLTPDKSKLTGKYVVEFVISPPWYRGSQLHRITMGTNGLHYLSWAYANGSYGASKGLFIRHQGGGAVNPAGTGTKTSYSYYDGSYESTNRMAEFGADLNALIKVTQLFDTDNNTVDIWFNEVYGGQRSFPADETDSFTSIECIDFNLYAGNVCLYDLRAYRPATYNYDATTGLSIAEDDESVTFATNAAKAGNLYFASYAEDTLAAIGNAALSLEPGKTYTVAKPEWPDIKAFFWDADLKPIVNAWDLQ